MRLAVECGVEEIFTEPVNSRASGLKVTQEVLDTSGYFTEATAIAGIRQKRNWSRYVVRLINSVQQSVRTHTDIAKLRILLYPSGLAPEDEVRIRRDDAGVIWLGKDAAQPETNHA